MLTLGRHTALPSKPVSPDAPARHGAAGQRRSSNPTRSLKAAAGGWLMQHRGGNTCSATGSSRIYGATAVIGVTPRVRPPRDPGSHCCLAVNR
ncbi:hypothetical protein DSI72_18030 [Mycobacterium tuberculosis]|nr:hypothetical protein DSI72_18030 [Mycobacterium tuberculosis]